MKKNTKWAIAALCAFAVGGTAQAQKQMVVKLQGSETPLSYTLSTIGTATFLDGAISFAAPLPEGATPETAPTVIKAFALKDIETITFTDLTSGIGGVSANTVQPFSVSVSGNLLRVKGAAAAALTIYATTGQVVKQVPNYAGSDVNIATLQPGVYLVKVGNQAAKFSK